jgi:hypothetical protein
LLLCTPFFSNAQEKEPKVTLEFENAQRANELIKAYTRALEGGDISAMSATLDKKAMIYGLGGGLDSLNVSQHEEYYTESLDMYKHSISQDLYLPVKVEDNWNEGEWLLS